MQRIRERNIKLNPEKCTFKAKEVSYMGHLLTADGFKPDPEKVAAIRNMHKPQNRTELQTVPWHGHILRKIPPTTVRCHSPSKTPLGKDRRMVLGRSSSKEF